VSKRHTSHHTSTYLCGRWVCRTHSDTVTQSRRTNRARERDYVVEVFALGVHVSLREPWSLVYTVSAHVRRPKTVVVYV